MLKFETCQLTNLSTKTIELDLNLDYLFCILIIRIWSKFK